jgi:hypothetical protein
MSEFPLPKGSLPAFSEPPAARGGPFGQSQTRKQVTKSSNLSTKHHHISPLSILKCSTAREEDGRGAIYIALLWIRRHVTSSSRFGRYVFFLFFWRNPARIERFCRSSLLRVIRNCRCERNGTYMRDDDDALRALSTRGGIICNISSV